MRERGARATATGYHAAGYSRRMPVAVRIFGRWLALLDEDGLWSVIDSPPQIAEALNALRSEPPPGVSLDAQRLKEMRMLYRDAEVILTHAAGEVQ